jgi:uncharacterized membrane protein YpjA
MLLWKRAVLLGFLSWLIPFGVSFLLFPLKRSNAALFGTLMDLILLATAGALLKAYFRRRPVLVFEALAVGALWLGINLVFDYPMFAYGPMQMKPLQYYSEIGIGYAVFPVFAFCAARLARAT